MRQIDAWQTSDGAVFTEKHKAIHHAEERYGNALTKLAHEVALIDKYTRAVDWIEANLSRFVELSCLSDDRQVTTSLDDDED